MNFKGLLLICFFMLDVVIFCCKSFAQLPFIKFEHLTSEDGLPSNSVYTTLRDKKGFMWFGTRLCPVRYDGATFQGYRALETTFVTGMAEDHTGNIWFASSENKVCYIDPSTNEIYPIEATNNGGDFYIDSKGDGWYSDRRGVNRINLKTHTQKHYPFKINKFIWNKGSFVEDSRHSMWVIGRDNGLFRYDKQHDILVCMLGNDCTDSSRNKQLLLTQACSDADGFLWIGSYSNGLIKYDIRSNTYDFFPTGRSKNDVLAVEEGLDDNGKRIIWIGDTHGIGVFRPDQNKFYFFENSEYGQFEVNDIFRDSIQGIVWISTSNGIIKYNPNRDKIKTIPIPPGLVNFPVTVKTIVKDQTQENVYYLGLSHTGMLRWNRLKNEFSLIPYESDQAETNWIVQRKDGNLWIGTLRWDYTRPGIFVYDPVKERFTQNPLSQVANTRFSVPFFHYGFFDSHDNLWIGNSDEGVRSFDKNKYTDVTPWDSLTQQAFIQDEKLINDIIETKEGSIILGTYAGVFYADDKSNRFIDYDTHPSLKKYPSVNSVLEDKQGNLWSARWGALVETDASGKLKTMLTTDDGFYDREIRGIKEDAHGNIWMGNWEGLYCYDISRKRLIRLTTKDGLVNNNTSNRIFLSNEGNEIMVGQVNSFNVVLIDKVMELMDHSSLVVSQFKVQDRNYYADFAKPIILHRSDNSFSVDVVALNYNKAHENQYAYYLEGLEDTWKYAGSNHLIQYTNLKPGHYTLHGKAGDGIEHWYNESLQLSIEILPAFYETWWFKSLIMLAISGVLYGLYRFRINQILRLHQIQNRISADLHDEIGASLSSISIMGTLAQNNMETEAGYMQFVKRIVEEVQLISKSLDDIVWNISPKHDTLSSLMARMMRYASDLFEAKQIKYEFTFPENVEGIRLSMEQRRNFYLIFKEAVNNLVKYSQCSLALVHIEVLKKVLILILKDNGTGFDLTKQSDRNGIRNMNERSKNLGGTISIETAPGKGTSIRLAFPIRE